MYEKQSKCSKTQIYFYAKMNYFKQLHDMRNQLDNGKRSQHCGQVLHTHDLFRGLDRVELEQKKLYYKYPGIKQRQKNSYDCDN